MASSDFDPLGPKTLAELHKPKLVVFDLSKQQWEELKVQYETNIGAWDSFREDKEKQGSSSMLEWFLVLRPMVPGAS